jgi:hypothetical protein
LVISGNLFELNEIFFGVKPCCDLFFFGSFEVHDELFLHLFQLTIEVEHLNFKVATQILREA